jgi:hypothetical protein
VAAALERGVLLDVLLVLVERRGADRAQLAAGEHRLEQVGGVDRTLGGARADDRVQLVHEQDDGALGLLDLLEDGLQPLLEVAAVLGAREQGADVERHHAPVAQRLGNVAVHDPLGQALDDRGLADAGLADQHRVVLGAPRQHLNDTTNLGVTADDGVELAFAGTLGQVGGVFLQRLVAALRIGVGDAGAAAHLHERLAQPLRRCTVAGEQFGDVRIAGGEADHEVFGRDVLVVHLGGQVLRRGDRCDRFTGQLRLRVRAAGAGQPVEEPLGFGANGRRFDADGLQ